MQFINDDMDDLFRESAEHYPLNTGKPDWDGVLQKMQDANVPSNTYSERKDNRKYYLLLLLLLPMFFICNDYVGRGKSEKEKNSNSGKVVTNAPSMKALPPAQNHSLTADPVKSGERTMEQASTATPYETGFERNATDKVISSAIAKKQKIDTDAQSLEQRLQKHKDQAAYQISAQERNSSITEKENPVVADEELLAEATVSLPVAANENKEHSDEKKPITPKEEISVKKDSASSEQPVAQKPKNERGVYIGVIAGPDYSMVKSTAASNAGYSIGILAGYRFSKSLAVETGLLWDRKKYKMEGRYFNKEKMDLQTHSNLLKVWGYCDMLEIPLNLRYDFSAKKNHNWFATAGLSSYLMKKEDYYYAYERYGNQYEGWKAYDNASTNWLSVVNVSIGYRKRIGSVGQLRIEPYLKLPLGGVGIGEMPLRSTGIFLGFTRPIR